MASNLIATLQDSIGRTRTVAQVWQHRGGKNLNLDQTFILFPHRLGQNEKEKKKERSIVESLQYNKKETLRRDELTVPASPGC